MILVYPAGTTKLALLVSQMEGFGHPGSLPERNNNPGDLRHAPQESHLDGQPDSIGSFATPQIGWAQLERQLQIDATRNLTIAQFVATYAPPSENDTANYTNFLCQGLGLPDTATLSQALTQSA
jgi:hypothetical protein